MIKTIRNIAITTIIIFFTVLVLVPVLNGCDSSQILRFDDVDLYINDEYTVLNNNDVYKRASENCSSYFPRYEDFGYKKNIVGFYIFDGTKTLTHTSISFVLELQFQNTGEFEQFISYEYSRCEYYFDIKIKHNEYECYITESRNLTYYYFEQDIPYQFGMLCENHEKLKIRYVYFRECESTVDEQFEIVFQNTNCNW